MKRKLTTVALMLTMIGSLIACNSDDTGSDKVKETKSNQESEQNNQSVSDTHYIFVDSVKADGFRNSDDTFINSKGEQIVLKSSSMGEVRNGICAYEDENYKNLALRDVTTGEVLVDGYDTYDWLTSNIDNYNGALANYIVVKKDDYQGIIDTNGNVIVELKYKDFDIFGTNEYPYIRGITEDNEADYYNKEFQLCPDPDTE